MAAYATFYVTCATQAEAHQLAQRLIELRLAACVNIIPSLQSYYEWDGQMQTATESALIIKSRHDLGPDIIDFMVENHSHDCPCVVEWPITSGHDAFLRWIDQQTTR